MMGSDSGAGVVQTLADVEHGEVHVGAPAEAQGHQAHALSRDRRDTLDAGYRRRLGFDALGDEALHLGGRDVRVGRVDHEPGVAHVG
jgi:hypothetical protein